MSVDTFVAPPLNQIAREASDPMLEEHIHKLEEAQHLYAIPRVPTFQQLAVLRSKNRGADRKILFGGGMGGGKSGGLCFVAIREARQVEHNRILMGRKTRTSFSASTLTELEDILLDCPDFMHKPSASPSRFVNKETGSEIWYLGVGEPKQMQRLGSTQFGAILLDEAPEIAASVVDQLNFRLRLPAAAEWRNPATGLIESRLLFIVTGNPWPGWIKRDFITKRKPGYEFIPALVSDNPFVYSGYAEAMRNTVPEEQYRAMILGDWNALEPTGQAIPTSLFVQAVLRPGVFPDMNDVVWGVDIARSPTGDESVIAQRRGDWFDPPVDRWTGLRVTEAAGRIIENVRNAPYEQRPHRINVDATGLGEGLVDALKDAQDAGMLDPNIYIHDSRTGLPADDRSHYVNKRAELFYRFRMMLEQGRGRLYPSDDLELDLTTPQRLFAGARIQIEAKELVKSHLGRSPNEGDAVLLTMDTGETTHIPEDRDEQLMQLYLEDPKYAEKLLADRQYEEERDRTRGDAIRNFAARIATNDPLAAEELVARAGISDDPYAYDPRLEQRSRQKEFEVKRRQRGIDQRKRQGF